MSRTHKNSHAKHIRAINIKFAGQLNASHKLPTFNLHSCLCTVIPSKKNQLILFLTSDLMPARKLLQHAQDLCSLQDDFVSEWLSWWSSVAPFQPDRDSPSSLPGAITKSYCCMSCPSRHSPIEVFFHTRSWALSPFQRNVARALILVWDEFPWVVSSLTWRYCVGSFLNRSPAVLF